MFYRIKAYIKITSKNDSLKESREKIYLIEDVPSEYFFEKKLDTFTRDTIISLN